MQDRRKNRQDDPSLDQFIKNQRIQQYEDRLMFNLILCAILASVIISVMIFK